ncbi:hypothetical protein [Sphingomonas sp.]|uniref:hypothetical protein n=1 Tax=Sphingomonas sp. TaxID=28214 RepID=UPI0025E5E749|nr:hypothetical protein [Sphingomonas sp.]
MRIGFLFNHDAGHQVAHSVGILRAYARANAGDTVVALVAPPLQGAVRAGLGDARVDWIDFRPGTVAGIVAPVLDRIAPFSRKSALAANLDVIAGLDALVATERTCLWARRKLGSRAPAFIYIPHGAGDRGVTYHQELAQFDLLLVPGRKYVEAARAAGLIDADNAIGIIGYPKFDTLARPSTPDRLFDNDNPVFVYNPHFDPYLSSWYDFGPRLIDWFSGRPDYNLIVAPHVMLFRKRFHWSLEYRTGRLRPDLPASASAPNILVDVDGPRLFDMSYMRAADVYIGDASSQIYEFMTTPRPAYFIDSHGVPIRHWRAGPVATSLAQLAAMLRDFKAAGARFASAQRALLDETFDSSPIPASERAATAIAEFMAVPKVQRAC